MLYENSLLIYASELMDEYGSHCEFLTVVERAPEFLGRDLTNEEAVFVHDIVQAG